MKTWHIITCEYPPQIGGVSDYAGLLTRKLAAAGDQVHVWAPSDSNQAAEQACEGILIHRSLGRFSKPDLMATEQRMNEVDRGPRSLLVQWVPHGFGQRAMNLAFCHWLRHLAKTGDRLELMIHEPYLTFGGGPWKQHVIALVQHRMIRIALDAASKVYLSIPAWERYLRPYASNFLEIKWLPIPATVPVAPSIAAVRAIRRRLGEPDLILGHLGTYGDKISTILRPAVLAVVRSVPNSSALLLGNNSERFADKLRSLAPDLKDRIWGAGVMAGNQLSHHLAACDLMLQPYPDGLSTRRTSLMNALAHGIPVVSNTGHLTEELWEKSGAVALRATGTAPDLAEACIHLLRDHDARKQLARDGADLYRTRFDWPNVIGVLRSTTGSAATAS